MKPIFSFVAGLLVGLGLAFGFMYLQNSSDGSANIFNWNFPGNSMNVRQDIYQNPNSPLRGMDNISPVSGLTPPTMPRN